MIICLVLIQTSLKFLGDQKMLSQVLIITYLFSQCDTHDILRLINNNNM